MHTKKKMRQAPLLVAAAAVLPIMLGACSSGSSSSSDAPAAQGGGSSTAQAGVAQFAQCMRQNGVGNFPDPSNGHFVMGGDIQGNPHFQSAVQTCQHYLGASGIGSNNNGQQSAALAFAQCMQTSGVPSFPDPPASGAIQAPPESVRNSPAYQGAFNKCKSKLPNGGSGLQG
ncbi:MAG TPA: hypothetical protein VFB06_29725 [Streptosporangiaceae bacterium]|nr:hypothetical protein [Streptosporangiaceae bacterium]